MTPETTKHASTILVADDSLAQRKLLQAWLVPEGYEVVLLTDGKEALNYLRRFTPDIAILDINMPHVDGLTICGRMKRVRRTRDVPVAMLTSQVDEKSRLTGEFVQADVYIAKPSSRAEMVRVVKELYQLREERLREAEAFDSKLTDTLIL